jgi:general secretion pathway protein L
MLKDYFSWWATQMRQWVPARFANNAADAHALIIVPAAGDSVTAILRRQRRDQALGTFSADTAGLRALAAALPERVRPPAIRLRLPGEALLEREVILPLVAEREAERILTFEMDRFTPFTSNTVFWTCSVQTRDRDRGKLHLRLSMVTKTPFQALLAALNQVGLAPTVIEVPRPDAPLCRIALQMQDTQALRRQRAATFAAAGACAALALVVAVLPFVQQSLALAQVEAHIQSIQPGVAEAEALQHRISSTTAGVDVYAAERARLGDALTVLADVTDKLPDDTYLTDLSLRQGKLLINGTSAAAVRLIAALSGDGVLRNPEFVAPVNRIDGGRADVFAIRAEVVK